MPPPTMTTTPVSDIGCRPSPEPSRKCSHESKRFALALRRRPCVRILRIHASQKNRIATAETREGGSMASRIVTVRLSEEQVVALETIASFDGVALAEELREGVQLLIAARRSDSEFHARVQASFEKARLILEGVEGGEAVIEA